VGGVTGPAPIGASRLRQLQAVGVLSGFAAGAWLGGEFGKPHTATLIAARPVPVKEGSLLEFRLDQLSPYAGHNLGRFRISYTDDPYAATYGKTPSNILTIINGYSELLLNLIQEGSPHIGDAIEDGGIAIVINTPTDAHSHADSFYIRRHALDYRVPYFTTVAGAEAAVEGIELLKDGAFEVRALQDYHADGANPPSP